MSPLTAKVKCPHYGGQINLEAEMVEAERTVDDSVRGAVEVILNKQALQREWQTLLRQL